MSELKVSLDREGVREMLRSDWMMSIVNELAQNALNKLGPGYEVTSVVGINRVNASIRALSRDAIKENIENNTILKALR